MLIFVALLLLILPGYLVTLFLPFISGFFKRLAFSIVLSISIEVALSYLLVVFNSSLIHYFLPVISGMILLLLVLAWRLKLSTDLKETGGPKITVIVREWKALQKKEKIFFGVILALSLAAGVFIFSPHFGYPWPIHADEWWDVSAVESVLQGRPLNTNPYLLTPYPDYKPGFTSLLSGFLGGLSLNPITTWPYLPAVNVGLISLIAAALLFDRTKNFWLAAAAPVFLAALRSNIYMLGWWFFVPSTFALLFVIFLLLAASDLFDSRSGLFATTLVALALGVVYMPFLGLVALASIPFLPRLYRRFPLAVWFASLAGFAAGIILFFKSPYRPFWPVSTPPFLGSFFVPTAATPSLSNFIGLPAVVPIAIFVLGLIGLWYWRRHAWAGGLVAAGVIGFLSTLLVYIGQTSFLVFYQRGFYFFGAVLAIAAGAGLAVVFGWLQWRLLQWGLVILIVLAVFIGYFNAPLGTDLYYLVTPADLSALEWLKGQPGLTGVRVLSRAAVGTIITPLSGLPTALNWFTFQGLGRQGMISDSEFFGTDDCVVKKADLVYLDAGLVYSNVPEICPFLSKLYDRDGIRIYRLVD